jgi:hypothetical protein
MNKQNQTLVFSRVDFQESTLCGGLQKKNKNLRLISF